MAKSAAKTTTEAEPIGEMILISRLSPSPTNPRKRFPDASINELAASILEQGVIEPLIVREIGENPADDRAFEIVCGERRYRASQVAELIQLPCIVRGLTDEQVLDIQIHENLHREDVHPMDEAYGYQFLKDKLGCTNEELALRVGKSEKFVAQRLKLNTLIEEAQADIEAGYLPLVYALEIAKYATESQKTILNEGTYYQESNYVKNNWVSSTVKTKIKPWSDFTAFIQKTILWQLSAAPFDLKATNLRPDGLACVACPDRSGANAGLFDAELTGKKDACLNPTCFRAKSAQLVVITRERIAHEATIETEQVPVIDIELYGDGQGRLGRYSFTVIGKKPYKTWYGTASEKTCDNSVTAVNISDGQFAKTYTVCLKSSGCKVHYKGVATPPAKSAKSAEKEREAELVKKRERREELVDVKVGEEVRKRVFRLAAEKFAATFTVAGGCLNLIPLALAKMWTHNGSDDSNTKNKIVRPILAAIMDVPENDISFGSYERVEAAERIAKLTPTNQNRLFFLLVHGNTGAMYYERYESQKPVRDLAEEYAIDYKLLDAEARLAWAEEKSKKNVDLFKLYLDAVRAGDETAKVPRPYAEWYKPKD